jgi:hypothetical protein
VARLGDDFQTTSWSLVLAAGDTDTARSRQALTAYCTETRSAFTQP